MTRKIIFLSLFLTLIFLSGCGKRDPTCPKSTGTPQFLTVPPQQLPIPTAKLASSPVNMEIGGKIIAVDQVVDGPLCNGNWSGTVYVTCNVQVYPWVESPTFLQYCNLTIEPETVVYVAYHNDAAYYKGCSCHTAEIGEP